MRDARTNESVSLGKTDGRCVVGKRGAVERLDGPGRTRRGTDTACETSRCMNGNAPEPLMRQRMEQPGGRRGEMDIDARGGHRLHRGATSRPALMVVGRLW